MSRVLLVGDTADRTNWGCRATTNALRHMIAERGSLAAVVDTKRWPVVNSVRTISDTRSETIPFGARFSFELQPMISEEEWAKRASLLKKKGTCFVRNVDAHCAQFRANNFGGLNDALETCDVIILNGEGGIMERRAPGRRLFFLLHYNAKYFQRPIAIVNHTCDLGDPQMQSFAAASYPKASRIRVREPRSLIEVAMLWPGVDLRMAADAAFAYRVAEVPDKIGLVNASSLDMSRPYVCVGGSAHWQKEAMSDAGWAAFFSVIVRLRKEVQVILLAAGTPEDMAFEAWSKEHDCPMAPVSYPTQSAVNLIGGAELYVGGRWHSAINALGTGTPVVLFGSNSGHKMHGLVEMLGVHDVPTPMGPRVAETASRQLFLRVLRVLERSAAIRAQVALRVEQFRHTSTWNVDILEY